MNSSTTAYAQSADNHPARSHSRVPVCSVRTTRAITGRVLREIFRDHRSRVFLIVAPGVLLVFVRYLFDSAAEFSATGVMMVGVFPTLSMYMVGSTLVVRERNRGTLEAILATPAGRVDLVAGYLCAAVVTCLAQAVCAVTVAYGISGLTTESPAWLLGLMTALCGIFGMSMGIVLSAVCRNESQASQLVPGFMVPQLLVCGVFWPVDRMSDWMQDLERFMPLSTVTRTMTAAGETSYGGAAMWGNALGVAGLAGLMLLGTAAVIRRRTA